MNRTFMDKAAATGGRQKTVSTKGNPTDNVLHSFLPSLSDEYMQQALSALEKQVFRLNTDIEKYMRLGDQLATPKDTVTLRASISIQKDEIQRRAKELKDNISKLNTTKQEMDTKQQDRLKKSVERFAQHLDTFQKALKLTADREVSSPPNMSTPAGSRAVDEEGENEHLLRQHQQQEVQRLDNMISYNEAIIEERDTEIQGLVKDIGELNEMFQDVAVMVHDQGTMVDNVETNAILTADRVQAGREELETAEKSQRAATSKKMCLAVVAGVVVGVICAILILLS